MEGVYIKTLKAMKSKDVKFILDRQDKKISTALKTFEGEIVQMKDRIQRLEESLDYVFKEFKEHRNRGDMHGRKD